MLTCLGFLLGPGSSEPPLFNFSVLFLSSFIFTETTASERKFLLQCLQKWHPLKESHLSKQALYVFNWREPYRFVPAKELGRLYMVLSLTQCINVNAATSSRDKHRFGVPWTVFSNTDVQSNPETASKWEEILLFWVLFPLKSLALRSLMLPEWFWWAVAPVCQPSADAMH